MTVEEYFDAVPTELRPLAAKIIDLFNAALPHCKTKVWHGIPVWFAEGNPIVTYFVKKNKIFVMFWNGKKFEVTDGLKSVGKYSAAEIAFSSLDDLDETRFNSWLTEARENPQTDFAMRVKV